MTARDHGKPAAITRRLRPLLVLAALAAVLLGVVAGTGAALAHPLGNFTINRYARIEVYSDAIHIHYVVDMAEIPTFQALGGIDRDGDGATSPEELAAFGRTAAGTYSRDFALAVDGEPLPVTPIETSVQRLPGQGGLDVMRIVVVYAAPTPRGDRAGVTFQDRNFSERVGWKEIVVRPSAGADVTVDPALLVDRSDALRDYPAESLKSTPDERAVAFSFVPGTGAKAPAAATVQTATAGRAGNRFASLINNDAGSFWVIVFSLAAAFGFGMIHALGPGHGKTVVAAYLVGSRGTVRHAVALGATVTATHTSTVYIVGFISLATSSQFATEKVQLYIGAAAGVMIIAMGLTILANRVVRYIRPVVDDGMHRHGIFGKAHSHMPTADPGLAGSGGDSRIGERAVFFQPPPSGLLAEAGSVAVQMPVTHAHAHEDAHAHEEPHGHRHTHDHHHEAQHAHPHDETVPQARVSWRSLITLGIAGGMLPCPSAIVVMISAVAVGKVFFGMLLIVAFSLGLASVLTAIGVGLVLGKRIPRDSRVAKLVQRAGVGRFAAVLPIGSALAVTLAGVGVTVIAVNQAQIF